MAPGGGVISKISAIRLRERPLDFEGGMHDSDRLARPDEPARPIAKDEPVAVNGHYLNLFVTIIYY
jgi:hypothetical protein